MAIKGIQALMFICTDVSHVQLVLQRVKTKVVRGNCNPVWNEELTIYIKDLDVPIVLVSIYIQFYLRMLMNINKNQLPLKMLAVYLLHVIALILGFSGIIIFLA